MLIDLNDLHVTFFTIASVWAREYALSSRAKTDNAGVQNDLVNPASPDPAELIPIDPDLRGFLQVSRTNSPCFRGQARIGLGIGYDSRLGVVG